MTGDKTGSQSTDHWDRPRSRRSPKVSCYCGIWGESRVEIPPEYWWLGWQSGVKKSDQREVIKAGKSGGLGIQEHVHVTLPDCDWDAKMSTVSAACLVEIKRHWWTSQLRIITEAPGQRGEKPHSLNTFINSNAGRSRKGFAFITLTS